MAFALAVACISGCSASGSPAADSTPVRGDEKVPELTVIVDGLDHPTQFANGPDGTLVIAQLAGGESDESGEVVVVDVVAGTRRTLMTGLDKPTGVLWHDGVLWVMVRRGLVSADWPDAASDVGPTTIVLRDLPFNGRSQGTLTLLDDGRFLYETTGNIIAGTVEEGSGTLWAFDPATNSSKVVATGIKNAYGHALLADGRIVTTDIGDNNADPPVDELDVLPMGSDPSHLGWPQCPGETDCDGVVRPLALFAPRSTPTSVAVVGDDVYVTLFVTGQLMRVSLAGWTTGDAPREAVEIAHDLAGPHTILARPDGTLWISEHFTGRLVAITP
ncbi:MAG: hypothetical protein LH616_12415 [Ilumatobacteraceae bacterium]|nr:hypothetical protein [Ilumatobacteraceae bacterium]